MGKKLNTDYPSAISELESVLGRYVPKKLYMKIFRGRSIEFDGYRKYEDSDDAKLIDWKASLRTNQILAKQYIEERDLKILFVVDVSESMVFGSTEKLKCEYAAEVSAALMHLILNYNDSFGLILFNDKIKEFVKPSKGKNQFYFLTDMLSQADYYGEISDFNMLMDYLTEYVDNVDSVFLLSDFLNFDEKIKDKLSVVSEKFELISLMIRDPLDIALPEEKREVLIEDFRTGEQLIINPGRIKNEYNKHSSQQINKIKSIFEETRGDFFKIRTDKSFAPELAIFLEDRAEKSQKIDLEP